MMQGRLVLPVIALGSLLSGCTQPQGGWQHDAVHRDTFIPETHRRHVVVVAHPSPETPGPSEIQKETAQIQADTARLAYQDRVFLAFSACQHDQRLPALHRLQPPLRIIVGRISLVSLDGPDHGEDQQ